PLLVHFVGGPQSDLKKVLFSIEQVRDAFARRQSPHLTLSIPTNLAPTFTQNLFFAKNGFASFAQSVAGDRVGKRGHRLELLRCRPSGKYGRAGQGADRSDWRRRLAIDTSVAACNEPANIIRAQLDKANRRESSASGGAYLVRSQGD